MDKRYQVFVSSTYADLQEERQEVMQALLELDCIPAGMELFPAANDDQWTLIKKVIDDCDYYIVIVAGRYGSIAADGVGYTEKEYRYALEIGKPIIGFVHKDPTSLPVSRCERDEVGRRKLDGFRDLVRLKLCKHWTTPAELGSMVSRSIVKLIKSSPGIGWVKGDLVPSESATNEILVLRRRVEELEGKLRELATAPSGISDLSQGDDKFEISLSFLASKDGYRGGATPYNHQVAVSWNDLFAAAAPKMIDDCSEMEFRKALNAEVGSHYKTIFDSDPDLKDKFFLDCEILTADYETIKVQFRALGLITKSNKTRGVKDQATYWTLTPYGDEVMTKLLAIRKAD